MKERRREESGCWEEKEEVGQKAYVGVRQDVS